MGNRHIQQKGKLLRLKVGCTKLLPSGTIIHGHLAGIKFTTLDIREDELADVKFEVLIGGSDEKGDVADISSIITEMAARTRIK